ncbi:hypothetical protein HYW42_01115 [Candidatus Daviesbacteria bacterium]|nr:hypothetical protein [Candidatus Daviesbacteria bacterium]
MEPPAGLNQLELIFGRIVSFSVALTFIALFVMLVWGGLKYITSGGEQKAVQAAHQTITWALLGVLFVIIAWLVLLTIASLTGISALKVFDPKVLLNP